MAVIASWTAIACGWRAAHYIDADLCRDPVVRQRATRCAEYLLSKLKPPAAPRSPAADHAAEALALLLNKPDEV